MAPIRAEIVNPFLMASKKLLQEVCSAEVSMAKPVLRDTTFRKEDWVITLGVTGEVQGRVFLGMTEGQACAIASKMCMREITAMDELASSAICELGNMILGNASTLLSNAGILTDITPPRLSSGDTDTGGGEAKALCVPMIFEGGGMDVYLALSQE
ncbi:MAG: chemotaxis protein CheX [Lachnospiraceae bacterium]|nr:chemotaxis protein CheX [Lachnospiraceae bacterium]